MKNTELVKKLKEEGQDFEFYPTTREIVQSAFNSIHAGRKDYIRRIKSPKEMNKESRRKAANSVKQLKFKINNNC